MPMDLSHLSSSLPDVEVEVVVRIRDGESVHRLCFHADRYRSPLGDVSSTARIVRSAVADAASESEQFVARAYPEQQS